MTTNEIKWVSAIRRMKRRDLFNDLRRTRLSSTCCNSERNKRQSCSITASISLAKVETCCFSAQHVSLKSCSIVLLRELPLQIFNKSVLVGLVSDLSLINHLTRNSFYSVVCQLLSAEIDRLLSLHWNNSNKVVLDWRKLRKKCFLILY